MIKHQIALIRRELWEHRSLLVTPAVLALLASLGTITGQVSISAFDEMISGKPSRDLTVGKNGRNADILKVITDSDSRAFRATKQSGEVKRLHAVCADDPVARPVLWNDAVKTGPDIQVPAAFGGLMHDRVYQHLVPSKAQ